MGAPDLRKKLKKSAGVEPAAKPAEKESRNPSGYVAPARKGKKALSAYFDPSVIDQMKILAIEQQTTVQALAGEALNDLFIKYQKPPIA